MDDAFVILDSRRELILRSWLPSLRVLAEGGDREAQKRLSTKFSFASQAKEPSSRGHFLPLGEQ